MKNITLGALPTADIAEIKKASSVNRLVLFNHYLNHKGSDIPNARRKSSNKPVIESIIQKFGRQYIPEKFIEEGSNTLQDLRQVAHLKVWEATDKYINGTDYKNKFSEYRSRFDFCIFASNYLNFQLRLHLRLLNRDRVYGSLPDSDPIRKLYTELPKYKKNNPEKLQLTNDDYKKISLENSIKLSIVIDVDRFMTSSSISGDQEIKGDGLDSKNKWEALESQNCNYFISSKNECLIETLSNEQRLKTFNLIKNDFLKTLKNKEKEIFIEIKLNDSENLKLKDLGKKYNLSSERVRQISEKVFKDFKTLILKNKKHLSF
jgi:hypothetical protein